MTIEKLNLDLHKDSRPIVDANQELHQIWVNDSTRNWLIYSKEKFSNFWSARATGGYK